MAVSHWFRSTPDLEAKKLKAKEKKDRAKEKKLLAAKLKPSVKMKLSTLEAHTGHQIEDAEDEIDELDSSSNASADCDRVENERPAKKAKKLQQITAYIDIVVPARTLKSKPTSDSRGPFFFTLETSHEEFLQSIACCTVAPRYLPTITGIDQTQLFWKLNVPVSDKKKPLANLAGYQAMSTKLATLLEKGKDSTITLSMPPLGKVCFRCRDFFFSYPFIGHR